MIVDYLIKFFIFELVDDFPPYIVFDMKLKITLIALVIIGMSACTQRTCPTYAKENIKQDITDRQADV